MWIIEQIRDPRNKPVPLWSIIFDTGSENMQWCKNSLFNKWCWKNWTDMYKKMKLDHLLSIYTRIKSKWIKDLNVRIKTIRILEEDTDSKILDISLSKFFPDILPWAKETKEKNKQMGIHQTKKFLHSKRNNQQNERQPTEQEKIFANDTSHKGLTPKIYKELTQLNTKKTNNPIKNGQRT